jgi:CheY-like chemotaxis protein
MFRIDFNKLRFLVCDDNPHMRRILRTLLHSFGAREVYESEDGATALEMYTHYVPDIVITDWSMPIFDGLELSQMILNVVANPRPFIRTKTYFGPDRRRNTSNAYIGPERRIGGEMEILQQPSLLDKARTSV